MSFGLFGQQSNQPGTGTALGGVATAPLFGSTFGQQQQTAPQQPVTGLFGQQQQQQPATGGLFGSTAATNQQPGQTGGLFGQQQQTVQQPATGGLFGNTAPTQPTTLFGSTATTAQQPGLFGAQQQPATAGTGLFGQPQQQQATGLFGAQTQQNQTQPTTTTGLFGGFGQTQAQQQPGTTLFGPPQQQPAATNALSATTTQNQQSLPSLFGTSTSNPSQSQLHGLNSVNAGQASTSAASVPAPGVSIQDRIKAIYEAWNPESPACVFTHYFYNAVDPQQIQFYGRPPNARNDAAWEKAMRTNPDPTCMVPVPANGFEDLQKRANAQAKFAELQRAQLKEASDRLEALTQKHALSTSIRAQRAALKQTELDQRLTMFVKRLHLMIPSVRATSIRPEEERLRATLESIEDELKRPGGLGRMKGKLSELWTAIGALKAMKDRRALSSGGSSADGAGPGSIEWAVVDETGLTELAAVLQNEQQGIAYVMGLLKQDHTDAGVMGAGLSFGTTSLGATSSAFPLRPDRKTSLAIGSSQARDLTTSLLGTRT